MSSADSGQAASGRIEALLQRVLEGVQQLESKVAAQSGHIQGLQNGLEGVQSKMDVVQADLDGVKGKLLVLVRSRPSRPPRRISFKSLTRSRPHRTR